MSRVAAIKKTLSSLENSVKQFVSSSADFRIVQTVGQSRGEFRTLFILDSSFNPPSIAHLSLATNAIFQQSLTFARPYRLLLLFSTHNADKGSFDHSVFAQRLAYMSLFAKDISDHFTKRLSSCPPGASLPESSIPIDIGLTKFPYYHDKSAAISKAEPQAYPSKPVHVHLIGYDTIIRVCAPRYYQDHSPPLSALAPFFEAGHRFLVTMRPSIASDKSSANFGTLDEQRGYLRQLRDGDLEDQGLKKEWANQIDMIESPNGEAEGVSSTRIREAIAEQNWQEVQTLCTPSVAAWFVETTDNGGHSS
ncbi:hypothetical protein EJ05DRAFT_306722 [Pseudovirgaria hyperparasitica]|uniref:Nucleotidylyl transferase n=1 Tax=Pseudovirgaria hyperparasitica TaxID=470096 RepID=A0A6A6WDQ6_9PEZI|nr:uncharacterized protein EJ05DRAFT_306722 [Pseudovirgaria hyperparasitica]KAF2759687.1 hypothetical protein EJ05DRAFT_306722 [Pseudovirgaria hyperparasitica]